MTALQSKTENNTRPVPSWTKILPWVILISTSVACYFVVQKGCVESTSQEHLSDESHASSEASFPSLGVRDLEIALENSNAANNEFVLDGNDRMRPGLSIVNSEVGMSSLTISAFILRIICTNGLIAKDECANSYRHVSVKILNEFPEVLASVSSKLVRQQSQLRISMESKVDDPIASMDTFNRQFQLGEDERNAVEWAWGFEAGETMFHVVNTYTKAAQAPKLSAENSYRLQRVGGSILNMVN
jgi:hypothetical protein